MPPNEPNNPIPQSVVQNPPIPQVTATISTPSTQVPYAGFWRRVIAAIIDGVIMETIFIVCGAIVLLTLKDTPQWLPFIFTIVGLLYFVGFESSSKQATPGKMIVGIKVTTLDGQKISFLRGLGRWLGKILSVVTLFIGFIITAFTSKKQALHDIIAGTLVVKYKESSVGKLIVTLLLFTVLIGGGVFVVGYYVILPRVLSSMGFVPDYPVDDLEAIESELEEIVGPNEEEILAPMTADQYEAVLSEKVVGVEGEYSGVSTYAGPAYLSFTGSTIRVALPIIPNIEQDEAIYIDINHVYSNTGEEINDAESSFNTDMFFKEVSLYRADEPVDYFKGSRSIHIIDGAKDEDVKKIEGTLFLNLPLSDGTTYSQSYPFTLSL